MKTKVFPLLSGVFALLLATSPIIPLFTQTALADTGTTQHSRGEGKFTKLNLTDDQKAQLQKIHESTRQQLDGIFTSEQKEQMKTARQDHQKPDLNLSEDQKEKINAVRTEAKTQIDAILTPEQRQQLKDMNAAKSQKNWQK